MHIAVDHCNGERDQQLAYERNSVSLSGACLHFSKPVFRIAMCSYPGLCKQNGGIPKTAQPKCDHAGYKDCEIVDVNLGHRFSFWFLACQNALDRLEFFG